MAHKGVTANTNTQIFRSQARSIKSDKVQLSWGGFKRVAEKNWVDEWNNAIIK